MKKTIALLLVILLMFNFIFANDSYASQSDGDEDDDTSAYTQSANVSGNIIGEQLESGTVSKSQGGEKTSISFSSLGTSVIGFITGILATFINVIFALQIDVIMSSLTASSGTDETGTDYNEFFFTIDRAVFNRIPLFNVNYFDTAETYKVGNTEVNANSSNIKIKESITSVYYLCRVLALTIGLLVLIYIGIRMAISTIASDQARYKKMLVSWVESVILIFAMPYLISLIFSFGELLTNIFFEIRNQLLGQDAANTGSTFEVFEETIRGSVLDYTLFSTSGLQLTLWSIIYWFLLFIEVKFLLSYVRRFLMVGLLITISPLITITYSIDKAGDGKAQAFSEWFKEFIVNVLIQPLHALIYLVFILTANSIAASSPVVAIAMLLAMGQVEKMVKVIFDLHGLVSLKGVDDYLKKEG